MVKKLPSSDVKQVRQDDIGKRQADKPAKNVPHYWNSKALAFEWWEPAPDGFCSSPVSKHRPNPKS